MTHSTISFSKYIQTGFVMLFLCIFLLIIFISHFQEPVKNSRNFSKEKCIITELVLTRVKFNCWNSGIVTLVEIPCIKIYVNISNFSNIIFFRNIQEKLFINSNNLECSYVPTACQNDADYLAKVLEDSYLDLFPPQNVAFECYFLQDLDLNALLFLPDQIAYVFSIFVLSFGFFLSLIVILYGWFNLSINSKQKYFGIINDLTKTAADENFLKYVRKILGEAHIDFDDVLGREIDIHINSNEDDYYVKNSFNKKPKEKSFSLDEYSIESHHNNQKVSDNFRSKANRLKLGSSEIHIGRIEYRVPSNGRLSRQNSTKSLYSIYSNFSDTDKKSSFYLGINSETYESSIQFFNNDNELNIPDPIIEEDERYISIQKKSTFPKIPPLNKIFTDS